MIPLEVKKLFRLPPSEIFGTAPVRVLENASLYVGGYPGIERVIGAEYDIDLPV
jgi:hypothetical protein